METILRQILLIFLLLVPVAGTGVYLRGDDYVEDVYFWQDAVVDENGEVVPHFNPKAKEIIFIQDTTIHSTDTVGNPTRTLNTRGGTNLLTSNL